MKKAVIFLSLTVMASCVALATPTMQWGITSVTSPGSDLGNLNGSALAGSQTDPLVGCYIQLLWSGANGVADAINLSNLDGHGNDDVVVAKGYVGFGTGFNTIQGYFFSGATLAANTASYVVGVDSFFIRTWNAPATSTGAYNAGNAPLGTATYYGNSGTHVLADNPTFDKWTLSSGFDTTIAIVPEPSSMALLIVGAGMVAMSRFRRR